MSGSKIMRKIQMGREVTPGTAVAATTIYRGLGTIEDQREVQFPEEFTGFFAGTDHTDIPFLVAGLEFDKIQATFEQLPHILEASIKSIGTGAADGSGTDKIYDYSFPTSALNTIKTYTMEGGDDVQAEKAEYCFVSEFTLEGKYKEAVNMSAIWVGRQVQNATFTPALTTPAVDDILFQTGKLYIDPVTPGNFGATQASQILYDFSLKVKTGWMPQWTADGTLYFTYHSMGVPEFVLELTYAHISSAVTEKGYWRTQTPRLLQLNFTGPTVATGGTAYQNKKLIINLAGKYVKFDKLDDIDGNDIMKVTFQGKYNPTSSKLGNIIVVNELNALP